ncbi:thermonuclease family protein [Bdellovibrionota bacterium]
MKHVWLIVVFLLLLTGCTSSTFEGHVKKVEDGDTVFVRSKGHLIAVRLADIDTPEKKGNQPYWKEAQKALLKLIKKKNKEKHKKNKMWVKVKVVKENGYYGRLIGRIYIEKFDINAEMVRLGYAWAAKPKYLKDESMLKLEEEARLAKRGLWAGDSPIKPWEWRSEWRKRKKGLSKKEN